MGVLRSAHVEVLLHQTADHLHDPLLLVGAFEQQPAHAVDRLALLIVNVVVFEQVFAGFEVLRLDGFLRLLNALGDELRFDGHILFHAQAQHQALHALAAEDAHQIVLQGEIEARAAGITLAAGAAPQLVVGAPRIVPLGAQDVQAAEGGHFIVLAVGLLFEARQQRGPFLFGHLIRVKRLFARRFARPHFGIAAQQNIGTASGHCRCNRYGPLPSRLRHHGRFALMVLGVQYLMWHPLAPEYLRQPLGLLYCDSTYQHGLAPGVQFLDLLGHVPELLLQCAVDHVRILPAQHVPVGGNHGNFELVDLFELGRFGFRRAGHAGQLLVHSEIVLEGDGGDGLVFALDLDALLGFHGLVQTIAPAAAGHQPAGEFVHDDDFVLAGVVVALDHVVAVAQVKGMRLDGLLDMVLPLDGGDVVDVGQAQQLCSLVEAFFGEGCAAVLLVDRVVAGGVFLAGFLSFDFFAAHEPGHDAIYLEILVGGFLARTGNDERRAGFIDQDGVDLVDDGVVKVALDAVFQAELHVVAQIIETELVVGTVGNVGVVAVLAFAVVEVVHDDADPEAKGAVDLAHPIGVAVGQVIVNRDNVDALAFKRVQVSGQGGDQRLTFAGLHFGDLGLVQHNSADQLYVEVAHVEEPAAGFADHSEGFDEQVVEGRALGQFSLELDGLGGEVGPRKPLHKGLKVVDSRHDGAHLVQFALCPGPENLG